MNYLHRSSPAPASPLAKALIRLSVIPGALSFVVGVATGIWKMGCIRGLFSAYPPDFLPSHGTIMVGAFLGTLVIFEKILPHATLSLFWVPYLWCFSIYLLRVNFKLAVALNLIALAGWIAYNALISIKIKRFAEPLILVLVYVLLSAVIFVEKGIDMGTSSAIHALLFPVATISLERIELSMATGRMLSRLTYFFLIVLILVSLLDLFFNFLGNEFYGLFFIVLLILMFSNDMTFKFLRQKIGFSISYPLHEFSLKTIFIAYLWLLLSAWFLLVSKFLPQSRDIVIHSTGLGFIFSMILAHAPVITSSFSRKVIKKPPSLLPFFVFQVATLLRIITDLFSLYSIALWQYIGVISGVLHFVSFVWHIAGIRRCV